MDLRVMVLLEVVLVALSLSEPTGAAWMNLREPPAPTRPDSNETMPADPNCPPADPNTPAVADPNANEPARSEPAEVGEPPADDSNEPAAADSGDPNEPAEEEDYLDMSLEELMEVEVAAAALTPADMDGEMTAAVVARERVAASERGGESQRFGVPDESTNRPDDPNCLRDQSSPTLLHRR